MQRVAPTHRRKVVRIGTAGWVIPRKSAEMAAGEGSHLERYARVFGCVEINSRQARETAGQNDLPESGQEHFLCKLCGRSFDYVSRGARDSAQDDGFVGLRSS